jgi:SH3 domain-containing YSC84-like protein 1
MKSLHISLAALLALGGVTALAEGPTLGERLDGPMAATNDDESTVQRASEVYRSIVQGPHGKVPNSVLSSAKCVAVFPNVVTAALGVGGIHGDGVAFCKNATNKWGSPVFLDLTGGSLGIQAGVKSADVVLFMSGDDAQRAIEKGNFALGGELNVVAGSFDQGFQVPQKGVVAYTRTGGAFAGASVAGVNISRDEDEQRSFYNVTAGKLPLFDGRVPDKVAKSVNELTGMLPS